MEIYELLKKDHKKVQGIFKKLQEKKNPGAKGAQDLVSELKMELMVHMEGEEKLFYPALEKADESREQTFESIEEHHITKTVLNELVDMPGDSDRWHAKLKVLQELVEHHIEEEEEKLFKQAQQVLDSTKAQEIGKEFAEEKKRQMKAM